MNTALFSAQPPGASTSGYRRPIKPLSVAEKDVPACTYLRPRIPRTRAYGGDEAPSEKAELGLRCPGAPLGDPGHVRLPLWPPASRSSGRPTCCRRGTVAVRHGPSAKMPRPGTGDRASPGWKVGPHCRALGT